MSMIERMQADFSFSNDVGTLTQLVHDGWKQVNVLTSKGGSHRGGHFHKLNRECFFVVSGSVALDVELDGREEHQVFSQGDFFVIAPYQMHSMYFPEDTVMVALYDIGVEFPDGTKDIYAQRD